MGTNKETSSIDHATELPKDLPQDVETIRENFSGTEDKIFAQTLLLKKTKSDVIVDVLQVVSSIAIAVATLMLVIFAGRQWDVAKKQAEAANAQMEVAKAQHDFMMHMNKGAQKSNLEEKPVDVTYYVGGSDDKNKIDMVFTNASYRPTAILSIDFKGKEGSILRTIGEADENKLPLNIGAWEAKKLSFRLKKGDIEQLEKILVTDLDNKQIFAEQNRRAYVKMGGPA
jgi:hypothetical protein